MGSFVSVVLADGLILLQNDFTIIISALEFRYGTKNLNYVIFQNYEQWKRETISELAD